MSELLAIGVSHKTAPVEVRERLSLSETRAPEFMRELRAARGMPVGLPATAWMAELGALALRSDTELLLKSRRVVPGRLLAAGFEFDFPMWPEAALDLARRVRARR